MPKLILLNGSPGSGKSTLARLFVENRALALNLDIDRLCALIGGWPRSREAFALGRSIALAAAGTHLGADHDVIVPQYVAETEFIERLEALAVLHHADFREIVLLDPKETALQRFAERSETSTAGEHRVAADMVHAAGGPTELAAMYDRLLDTLSRRPNTKIIRPEAGNAHAGYRDLLAALD